MLTFRLWLPVQTGKILLNHNLVQLHTWITICILNCFTWRPRGTDLLIFGRLDGSHRTLVMWMVLTLLGREICGTHLSYILFAFQWLRNKYWVYSLGDWSVIQIITVTTNTRKRVLFYLIPTEVLCHLQGWHAFMSCMANHGVYFQVFPKRLSWNWTFQQAFP